MDTNDRTDDDFGENSRSVSPINDGGEVSVASMDDNTLGNDETGNVGDENVDERVEESNELEAAAEAEQEDNMEEENENDTKEKVESVPETEIEQEAEAVEQVEATKEDEIEAVAAAQEDQGEDKADAQQEKDEEEKAGDDTEEAVEQDAQSEKDRKKKRKRGSSILRGLGLEPPPEVDNTEAANTENEEETRRYQSSRSAAAAAKSKLSGKSTIVKPDGEAEVPQAAAKPKKSNKAAAAAQISNVDVVATPAVEWAQCDDCGKWRSVATHISASDLPEQWYCRLSTWSTVYNNCEAGEEPVGEDGNPITPLESIEAIASIPPALPSTDNLVAKAEEGEKSAMKPKAKSSRGKKEAAAAPVNEGEGIVHGEEKKEVVTSTASKKKEGESADNRRRSTGRQGAKTQSSANPDVTVPATPGSTSGGGTVSWVQCNKCQKWRKTPAHIIVDDLPEEWYCSLNTWNPLYAKCSAKEEQDDPTTDQTTGAATASANQHTSTPATKEKSAKGKKPQNQNVSFASPTGNTPGAALVTKTNWVRCEQKNCKKWRKVPHYIDVDKLPEKWYCSMNTWNPDTASCDAAEESDSEAEGGQGGANAIASLIALNSKSANSLSYRRIIFGNDGKIRMCFSDKNKNGFGIFSYLYPQNKVYFGSYDESVEPKRRVMYWWSSAYDESAVLAQMNSKTNRKTVSALFNDDKDTCADYERKALNSNMAMKTDSQSTYLLDSIRRMYGMSPSINHIALPKQMSKAWKLVSNMSLIRRQQGECTVIRSVYLTSSYPNILLTRLQQLIGSCRFQNPEIDACREFMTHDGLKMALRRMEINGEIEVSFTKDGQLVILLLMPMSILKATLAAKNKKFDKIVNKVNLDGKWTKEGYPLKMRKFFANGSTSLMHLPVPANANDAQPPRRTRRSRPAREENVSANDDQNKKETEETEEGGDDAGEEEAQEEENEEIPFVDEVVSNALPADDDVVHEEQDENDDNNPQEDGEMEENAQEEASPKEVEVQGTAMEVVEEQE